MKALFTFFIITFFSTPLLFCQDQVQTYEMRALGVEIGTLQTSRKIIGNETYYRNHTVLEVNLIFKRIKMEVENKLRYRAGQFMSTENHVIVNGELHSSARVEWTGEQYNVVIDGEVKPPVKFPVYFSGTLLYYQEPAGISRAFSESSGIFMDVKPLGDGKYQVIDPVNDRNKIHYYEKGVQTKVAIKHTLLTVYMIRKDPFGKTQN